MQYPVFFVSFDLPQGQGHGCQNPRGLSFWVLGHGTLGRLLRDLLSSGPVSVSWRQLVGGSRGMWEPSSHVGGH